MGQPGCVGDVLGPPLTSRSGVVEWYTWAMHYLDTPSMGLPTPETVSAITAALTTWQEGAAHYGAWEETMERCRELFAQLVDVSAGSVGLLSSIVPAVAAVADSLSDRGGTVVAHPGRVPLAAAPGPRNNPRGPHPLGRRCLQRRIVRTAHRYADIGCLRLLRGIARRRPASTRGHPRCLPRCRCCPGGRCDSIARHRAPRDPRRRRRPARACLPYVRGFCLEG